jgi:hypothetical protein
MMAFGVLLISVALLALAAVAIAARKPNAPRWTTANWAGELIVIAVVSLFAFGLPYFVAGVASAYREGAHLVDVGLLAVVLCGAFLIGRRLVTWARLRNLTPTPAGRLAGARGATGRAAARASANQPSRSRAG